MSDTALLKVKNLKKHFFLERGFLASTSEKVLAVNGVSFVIGKGETLGLVGESGSGKTTVGRCVLRLVEPTSGRIELNGMEITGIARKEMKRIRRKVQIIFQDPYGSLTPRLRLYSILKEPLAIHGIGSNSSYKDAVALMLQKVGLRPEHMMRFPHEFSGGQRQRIAIARALMLNPDLIIADEPVSALDVSIQAQIINLMVKLQKEFELSYLLITHDLSVVKYMADRIAVMYLGKIVELADRDELYLNPLHPYTGALISAIPKVNVRIKHIKINYGGEVPSPIKPPSGCSFHPRCDRRMDICDKREPKMKSIGSGHMVACHLYVRGQNA